MRSELDQTYSHPNPDRTTRKRRSFTRTVRVIGPTMSAAFVMVMFPVSSSIWKMFPSFPDERKTRRLDSKCSKHFQNFKSLKELCLVCFHRFYITAAFILWFCLYSGSGSVQTSQDSVADQLAPVLVSVLGEHRTRFQHQRTLLCSRNHQWGGNSLYLSNFNHLNYVIIMWKMFPKQ